jgi:hypothetical protein
MRIGGTRETKSGKFLGLLVTDNLTWVHHVRYLIQKLTAGCFALAWAKCHTPCKTILHIYRCIFESHLMYGTVLWGSASTALLNGIVSLQKGTIRYQSMQNITLIQGPSSSVRRAPRTFLGGLVVSVTDFSPTEITVSI